MIIWLASYPRSGNTLVRNILHRSFGLATCSKYNDVTDIGADPTVAAKIGHVQFDGRWTDAYARFRSSPNIHLVKTHDAPEDDAKAIFIVRHGWSSIVSNQHYLRDFGGIDASLCDIISGRAGGFPSWGRMLDLWDPAHRPNTLVIKYEDLLTAPDREIARMASFLELKVTAQWQNDFKELHQLNPRFFRQGRKAPPQKELGAQESALFACLHGDWMGRFGYAPPPEPIAAKTAALLRSLVETDFFVADGLRRKNELDRQVAIARQQAEYIAVLTQECDRLTAEAKAAQAEARRAAQDGQKHIDALSRQIDKLAATTAKQAAFILTLEKERDRLAGEAAQAVRARDRHREESDGLVQSLKKQLDQLAATALKQTEYIATLEKERSRQAAKAGLGSPLRQQLDDLAATSRQQAGYIAVLEKERDRLTAESQARAKDGAHYVEVIAEQTKYIKVLEARSAAGQAPTQP